MNVSQLLDSYPRSRPPLTPAHQQVYEREYKLNRDGRHIVEGLAKRMESWMHRRIAAVSGSPTLELGAGTLNHLRYEPVVEYDIVEPKPFLFQNSPRLVSIRKVFPTIASVTTKYRYQRIISIAVLEHMVDLPRELARCCLLLQPGGVFQAGIPSQGGFLWWTGWRLTTGITYWLRNRLDYGVMMKHEHVNSAAEVETLTRYFFDEVEVSRFPLPWQHTSFYAYIVGRRPRREVASHILLASSGRN